MNATADSDVNFGRMPVPHFRENTSVSGSASIKRSCRWLPISFSVIAGENTPVTIPFFALELRRGASRGVVSVDNLVDNWKVAPNGVAEVVHIPIPPSYLLLLNNSLFHSTLLLPQESRMSLLWKDYSVVERPVSKNRLQHRSG